PLRGKSPGLWLWLRRRHRPASCLRHHDRRARPLAGWRTRHPGRRSSHCCARRLLPGHEPGSRGMSLRLRTSLLTALLLLTQMQIADAHIVSARLGDFYAGALHPLLTLQDVVAWAALGLLAGSLG